MIGDIIVKDLGLISDDRGYSFDLTEKTIEGYSKIEVQEIYPNVVRGWYQQCNDDVSYVVPKGRIKLVVFDDRSESCTKGEFQEIFMGDKNSVSVYVPSGLWVGYKCIGTHEAIILTRKNSNVKEENIKKLDPDVSYIKYNWGRKNK